MALLHSDALSRAVMWRDTIQLATVPEDAREVPRMHSLEISESSSDSVVDCESEN